MRNSPLVDFIGIGAPKAATTWIYECLKEHPEICMSKDKEVDFFLGSNFERGLKWYARQFAHCSPNILRGEFSPNYLYSTVAAQRMYQTVPEAKLIISLRNPIERFISQFYFEYGMARHNITDITSMPPGMRSRLIRKSSYYQHIKNYLELFPRENIYICIYEDIAADPVSFIQDIYQFLGVDATFTPSQSTKRSNVTALQRTRFRALKRWYYRAYQLMSKSRFRTPLATLFRLLGITALVKYLVAITENTDTQPIRESLPAAYRDGLHKEFARDIRELERLLGRTLDFWR